MKQLTISTFVMISSGSNDISSSAAASKTKKRYNTYEPLPYPKFAP